jgi:hypothetical protein
MCMSDKSRDAWPEAIADGDAPSLVCCEKQFSTKEPQEAPLPKNHSKLQENHNVFNEYSLHNASQLINSGPVQRTYIEKHGLFNQILGSRGRITQKRRTGNPDLPAI